MVKLYSKLLGVSVVAAVILTVWAYTRLQNESPAPPAFEKTRSSQDEGAEESLGSNSHLNSPGVSSAAALNASISPFSHVPASRLGMPLATDPFEAGSVEEQRWLDRNGFPNEEQLRVYSTASDGLLEIAAQSGDRLAQVEFDGRLLMRGERDAIGRLFEAAEEGSLYALTKLAGYMAVSPEGSPALAYSISRLQEIRGDTRVALARDLLMRRPLEPMEKAEAELEALRMARELEARFKGGNFRDPRPSVR